MDCVVEAARIPIWEVHFWRNINVTQYPIFYLLLFKIVSFDIKLFVIKYSIGICSLNLEYCDSIVNNMKETKNVYENSFSKLKFMVIIFFCHYFGFNSTFFVLLYL